ncbi:putative small membrane protein [Pseudomonas syringae pv. primulae]|nr:putative small membrane protein [Pseudomonas syringae pv. primulae]
MEFLMLRSFLMLAAFFGFTGVALGAFAAHGLKGRLTAEYLTIFQTGVLYQLVHALALLGVAVLAAQLPGRLVTWAGISFAIGILLFSGSLYALTLTGISKLGIITPFGGLAFLFGWATLGLAAWRLGSAP